MPSRPNLEMPYAPQSAYPTIPASLVTLMIERQKSGQFLWEGRGVISKWRFPDVQRRSRGSATLPRHACQHHYLPFRSTPPSGGLFRCSLSVEFGQDRLNSSNGSVAIFHPRRRHESLVQLQVCPNAHQPKIVCNMEPDHLDEIFERVFACLIENHSHRQRLVEFQALAGLCETANIYPLRLFQ